MPVEELREAEVEHLDVAVWPQHHVLRLDVTVRDPARVCCCQRARDLNHDPDAFAGRHGAALEALPQRLAIDQLADDERPRVEVAEVMNHEDIRMIQ